MAKIGISNGNPKTDLNNIILIDNIRNTYEEIEERARSIETKGQLSPVIVQASKEEPGKFNLIAGYCRYKAFQLLISEGKPYNQVEYTIKTGDPLTIQITENIQRSNLKSVEIENALKKMIDRGDSQQDIVLLLNKSKSWVSDVLKAHEIRAKIKTDTSIITSSALKHLRSVPVNTISKIIPEIIENGGTVAAVKLALRKYEESINPKRADTEIIPKHESKDPEKRNKQGVKDQSETPAAQNHFKGLFVQLDKLVDSGHAKEQIIESVNSYLEGLK